MLVVNVSNTDTLCRCFIMSRWGEPTIDEYTRFPQAGSFTHVLTRLYHIAIFSRVNAQILRSLKHCVVDCGRWNRWLQMNKVSALTLLDVLVLPIICNDPSKHRYLRIFNTVDSAVVGFHSVSLLGLLGVAAWMVNQPNSERPVRRVSGTRKDSIMFALLTAASCSRASVGWSCLSCCCGCDKTSDP